MSKLPYGAMAFATFWSSGESRSMSCADALTQNGGSSELACQSKLNDACETGGWADGWVAWDD